VTGPDPRAPQRGDRLVALAVALVTFAALALTDSPIGVPRDESYYFRAGADYAAWYGDVWDALKRGHPFEAFADPVIVRRFEYNHEHPVLTKVLYGLSHHLFTDKLHWLSDIPGFRLPAWAFSALLSAILYLFAARLASRRGALFAVAAFWLVPRQFFHGHLACFDMPMACVWLLTAYCYWRSLSRLRWAIWTGVAFGLALSTKHNAWIIPGVFLIHFLLAEAGPARRAGGFKAVLKAAAPFFFMAGLGPVLFYLCWPYLWHAPLDRFVWYVNFHAQHINYPWEFFGTLLVEPPFPIGYAFALTAVTVPFGLLVLMATGALREVLRFAASYVIHPLRRVCGELDSDSLLLLGNAFASLAVLSMPNLPIFGGVKHWLPSMPFLMIFAARALERVGSVAGELFPRTARLAFPLLAALALAPALWGVVHNHPYGTSFYNEVAGGYPGGASLGMHRQYWSNNVTGVLDWLNKNAPPNARVFFHEVTWDSFLAYRKAGLLRDDLQYAAGPEDSQLAAYQYMPEFRDVEMQIWNVYRTQTPVFGLYLDETPQVVIYRRP
jgi:4-amino-4-deoxy-L-arabinose transferase-like glycosyltransferase